MHALTSLSLKYVLPAVLIGALTVGAGLSTVHAGAGQDAIIAKLAGEAKAADAAFAGFDEKRGKAFFLATQTTGKPETPSCSTCHGKDPKKAGQTRVGKTIAAMAVSVTPDRFTDPEKVAKWFTRNCNNVVGRECTALEKGDFVTYMTGE